MLFPQEQNDGADVASSNEVSGSVNQLELATPEAGKGFEHSSGLDSTDKLQMEQTGDFSESHRCTELGSAEYDHDNFLRGLLARTTRRNPNSVT
jgi:hypothetical protein